MIEVQKYNREKFNYDNYKYAFLTPPVYSNADSNFGNIFYRRHFYKVTNKLPGWIDRRRKENKDIELEIPQI